MEAAAAFAMRPMQARDQAILWDIFHVALWDPPPAGLRPRSVLERPDVRIYAEGWGREGDIGILGEWGEERTPVGGAWMRLIGGGQGLAWIDERTPQLGIALFPPFQRRGLGRRILVAALEAARERYAQVSLSVHPLNPAVALYERCGFRKVAERNGYFVMVAGLTGGSSVRSGPGVTMGAAGIARSSP